MLNLIIGIFVFFALLIGAEGTRLLRDKQAKGDPTGAIRAEEAPCLPRGKRVPVAEINSQFIRKTSFQSIYEMKIPEHPFSIYPSILEVSF
jgi:hypothetical protein